MSKKKKDEAQQNEYSNMPAGAERREVRTTAEKVHHRNQVIRVLLIVILLLILLLGITYACMAFVNNAGRFTINLDPDAFQDYGLSISDFNPATDKEEKNGTIILRAEPVEDMTNITKEWLLNSPSITDSRFEYNPDDQIYSDYADLDKVDGCHNGKNYIAYTFYLSNNGEEDVGYVASLDVKSVSKGADEAVRIMIFENGVPTTYGKAPKDRSVEYADYLIEKEFVSDKVVMQRHNADFKVGDVDKYTIVIWLEGWDPECVNDILGGEVKFQMDISVIDEVEATE